MHGHLHLHCALDTLGQSHLVRQSFRPPFHISKPHRDPGGALVVNLASVSPGLLEGDTTRVEVSVATGARLVLTQPAANRLHRMTRHEATQEQRYTLAPGAALEIWPELFIPQADGSLRQTTEIRLHPDSELILAEFLAPGRTASGETFAYRRLRWRTVLIGPGERPLHLETADLHPGSPALRALRQPFPATYHASLLVHSPALALKSAAPALAATLHHLHDPATAWIGASHPAPSLLAIKILAAHSPALRRLAAQVRHLVHQALGHPTPDLRRI